MLEYVFRLIYFWLTFYGCIWSSVASPPGMPDNFGLKQKYISTSGFNEDLTLTHWISDHLKLGQVSGISTDPDDNIYIFHRVDRIWDDSSFTNDNIYSKRDLGPIPAATILIFKSDGTLIGQRGQNLFFLPHGITVDRKFNVWVTDVALHQVMKLPAHSNNVSLVLGKRFIPGNDSEHFCKPTSVAVVSNGDFFVADGYCNSRIIKFNSAGQKVLEWGRQNGEPYSMQPRHPGNFELNVPHALTLAEDKGLLCVADRENGRILCYYFVDGGFYSEMSIIMWNRLFSVAYSNGMFFAVIGKNKNMKLPFGGYVLNMTGNIIGQFGSNLNTPHDIAVSSDGKSVYVGEIRPYKAWKYINNNKNMLKEDIEKSEIHPSGSTSLNNNVENVEGLTGAILVTFGCFVFAIGLFMAMLIYSKSKKTVSSDSMRLLSNVNY